MPASEVRRAPVPGQVRAVYYYVSGDCSDVYSQDSDNCDSGCGVCFNGQGGLERRGEERRLTVLCSGRSSTPEYDVVTCPASGSPGYYCNPEGGVFACMDWTAGSHKLQEQEEKFSQRT